MLLQRCTPLYTASGIRPLTDDDRKQIEAQNAALAQQAKAAEAMVGPGQLATMLASVVMAVRVVVVAALIDRRVALAMAGPLGALAVGLLLGAAWKWRALKAGPAVKHEVTLQNPFRFCRR